MNMNKMDDNGAGPSKKKGKQIMLRKGLVFSLIRRKEKKNWILQAKVVLLVNKKK